VLFFLFVAVSSLLHSVGIRRWHAHTHKVYSLSALYLLSICSLSALFFSICFFGGVAGRVGWVLYLSVLIIMLFFFFLSPDFFVDDLTLPTFFHCFDILGLWCFSFPFFAVGVLPQSQR